MTVDRHCCVVCEQDSQQIPLISIEYKDRMYWICPEHFPILIHEPAQLIGRLPGVENLQGHHHD